MGVANTSGDNGLFRTASLPTSTAFTMVGQTILDSIPGAADYGFIAGITTADTLTNYLLLGWFNGGFSISSTPASVTFGSVPTAGQPFAWAITCSGTGATDCKGYWRPHNGAIVTASTNGVSFTTARMVLGNNTINQPVLGTHGHVKAWDAALTQDELLVEMSSWQPKRFANLHLYTPLWVSSDVKDYSGNAKDWSALNTMTTGVTPPSPSGANSRHGRLNVSAGGLWLAAAA